MLDRSVLLEGVVVHSETGAEQPLRTHIAELIRCDLQFDEPLVFDSPRSVSVSVQIDHMRWFDGIDFAQLGGPAVQQKVTENIRSSLVAERI